MIEPFVAPDPAGLRLEFLHLQTNYFESRREGTLIGTPILKDPHGAIVAAFHATMAKINAGLDRAREDAPAPRLSGQSLGEVGATRRRCILGLTHRSVNSGVTLRNRTWSGTVTEQPVAH